jgi:uroporphyrinogen-III synthase
MSVVTSTNGIENSQNKAEQRGKQSIAMKGKAYYKRGESKERKIHKKENKLHVTSRTEQQKHRQQKE